MLTPAALLVGTTVTATALTLGIVSLMSLVIYGRILSDYLFTGFVAAFLVSLTVAFVLTELIKALQRSKAELLNQDSHIQRMAHYDPLTGLPNRELMRIRFSQALASSRRHKLNMAILFLDLDRFKQINDSLGHMVGDQLLCMVAERLNLSSREEDTIARLGGDEFLLVLPETNTERAARYAEKLLGRISEPYLIERHQLKVTPSIGIGIYPDDGLDMDTLIKKADSAMYHAKREGRNNFQFFRHEVNQVAHELMMLEHEIRSGLEQGHFQLHFQPQVSVKSGEIIGVEALVRWLHPERGLLMPERFIPLAEESSLIIAIGDWVLRKACQFNRRLQDEGLLWVPVAVNLAAIQLRQNNLADRLADILGDTGLDPHFLELEIAESVLLNDIRNTMAKLSNIKKAGVHLAIDDFGTGYSILSYLKHLPNPKLKIESSFVQDANADLDGKLIVRSIIGLAHNLHLKVIAEGVETAEQLKFLGDEGCDEYQGYFFSKPLAQDEFIAFVHELKQVPAKVSA